MDSLNRNGLQKIEPLIPNRNTTLNSQNNVLQPNTLKTNRLIANQLYKDNKTNRIQNIHNDGILKTPWDKK